MNAPAAGLFDLSGRVALVTGAARGLGAAMAEALVGAGAQVILNDRDAGALEARCTELAEAGHTVDASVFDVTDGPRIAAAMAAIEKAHGGLDILVNNAGIAVYQPAVEHDRVEWDQVMEVNLTALYEMARAAVPLMLGRGRQGRIINVASVLGLIARPGVASYVTSKHAVIGLTRSLAAELGPRGITCNALAPGYFLSPMSDELAGEAGFHTMIGERTPLRRWGRPEDLAGPVLFLASAASAFVTGHVLVVDGGITTSLF